MNTLFELSEKLKKREISSLELTKAYIGRIEEKNPLLNAVVHKTYDKALALAERADKRLADGNAPLLCGIPVLLKDNICSEGDLTTCCSKMLSGYRPPYDATAWKRLEEQGMVLLGKTNMDEFAFGSTSETSCYGAPKNPVDPSFITGGSSGGSAAAVSAGFAPVALGSDTGGSVRQPASFCGVVGLKPTYGAVSRYGLIAYASSFDQIGVFAGSVKEAGVLFGAIRGTDSHDMTTCAGFYSAGKRQDGELSAASAGRRLKLAIVRELSDGIDEDVKNTLERARAYFSGTGAEIAEVSIPSLVSALPAYYIIACAEASSNLGRYDGVRYGHRAEGAASFEELAVKSRNEGFGDEVKRRIMLGTYVLSGGYYDAWYRKACEVRETVTRGFLKTFEKYDVILAPTSPFIVPRFGEKRGAADLYRADMCTAPANLSGLPAISVPSGKDRNGMPIGLQIIGNRFDEETVLFAAEKLEQGLKPQHDTWGGYAC